MPAPAQKSIQLHNDLIATAPSDVERIRALSWQLRQMRRQNRSDFRVNTTLMLAFLMAGDRKDYDDLFNEVKGSHIGQPFECQMSYLETVLSSGNFVEGRNIIDQMIGITGALRRFQFLDACVQCAVALADLKWLKDVADKERAAELSGSAEEFLRVLDVSPIARHFPKHQEIVLSKIESSSCICRFTLVGEEEMQDSMSCWVHASLDRDQCKQLEDEIHSALMDFYRMQDEAPGVYIPEYGIIVSPISGLDQPLVAA
tara:strand:- start:127811 stop:128584 length:774 start_codon:yes stop_codon:yes gene_type:complete